MIELYGARTGNCLRVSVALEEALIPYRVRRVDLRHGEHMGAQYKAINPEGKVPTMVNSAGPGGRLVLSQSNAILFYLAELAPGALLPTDVKARALALQRFFYILTDVIGPNHAAFRLRMTGGGEGVETLQQFAALMLARVEGLLEADRFIAGEAFGLADIAVATTLSSVLTEASLAELPRLAAWHASALARPSVINGMRAFATQVAHGA